MKIQLDKKTIAKDLLGFAGVQVLTVVIGISHHYLLPHEKPIIREETKTIEECRNDVLYGAISALRNPVEQSRDETKLFRAYLIGTTTGPSGDSTIEIPV